MFEGRLTAAGGADLLSAVWQQERTGLLEITAGGAERTLVLSGGEVVYLSSSEAAEKLPVRLIQRGIVPREAVVAAAKAGPDLRKELAASGALAPEAHDAAVRELVAEVCARIFPLAEGKFTLVDRDLSLPGILAENPMEPVLWRAARGCPADRALAFIGSTASRVTRASSDDALGAITDLSAPEGYLLSRIDGYGSVDDLLGMSPLPREQTLVFVLALCCVGVIDVTGRPGLKLPRPAKTTSRGKRKTTGAKPASSSAPRPAAVVVAAAAPLVLEGIDAARDLNARIASSDHYGVLGLKPAADGAEIRKAYYALARSYHPDRFGKDLTPDERELVEGLFARISEAFSVLSDEELRKEYDEKIRSGALAAEQKDKKPVDKKELARESYEKGRALVSMGDKGRALSFFEHAVEVDKDSWEYRMALARLLMSDTRLRKRAEIHLQEAIRIDSSKADAYHQLGLLYKMAGVRSRAVEQLRAGLKWDAGHAGILAELDEIEGRSEGGGLKGLFGKKK